METWDVTFRSVRAKHGQPALERTYEVSADTQSAVLDAKVGQVFAPGHASARLVSSDGKRDLMLEDVLATLKRGQVPRGVEQDGRRVIIIVAGGEGLAPQPSTAQGQLSRHIDAAMPLYKRGRGQQAPVQHCGSKQLSLQAAKHMRVWTSVWMQRVDEEPYLYETDSDRQPEWTWSLVKRGLLSLSALDGVSEDLLVNKMKT